MAIGRPPDFTDEQIAIAIRKAKGMITLAAKYVGCSPATIHARKKRPIIWEALIDSRAEMVDMAEMGLFIAARGDPENGKPGERWAIEFILRYLGRDRGYAEKVEHALPVGYNNVTVVNLQAMSDEQLERYERQQRALLGPERGAGPDRNGKGPTLAAGILDPGEPGEVHEPEAPPAGQQEAPGAGAEGDPPPGTLPSSTPCEE